MIQRDFESENVRKRKDHQANVRDDPTDGDSDVELGKVDTILLCTVPKCVYGPTCTDRRDVLVLLAEYGVHLAKTHTVEMAQETMRKTNPWRK